MVKPTVTTGTWLRGERHGVSVGGKARAEGQDETLGGREGSKNLH